MTSGYADITYRIDNSTDYFYITDPCKAEIMISRDTPAGIYALHISATAAADDLHKKTSKTINYKLIVYENAQTEITLDHGMHGTGGDTSAVAEIGKAMPVIKPPTADTGYVFDGYYDAESGGTKYYNAEGTSARVWDKDTESYTLLAQWMPESYTITYDLAGGTVSGSNHGTYTIESDSITLINPTKDGYIFTGWTGTGLDSPAMSVTISAGSTGDRSYTATWERRYEIEIHSNNTEYGTVSAAAVSNLPYGTAITASENVLTIGSTDVTATASENTAKYSYSFKEWSGIPAGGTVTADIAITAVFERVAQKYTVTFEGNFEGSEYSESITETYGSKYIIPTEEPKRTGYTFHGWYTNSTGGTKITSDSVVDITSDTTLYAQWTPESYTITYDLAGGTVSGSNPGTYTIESDSITLINPTKGGYIFTGWTGTGLDSPAMSVTIPAGSTGDRSYTATWERRYEIEIHSNNTEYGTVSAAAVSNLPYGTAITASENVLTVGSTDVTAAASENTAKYSYSFKEWSGIPAGGTVTADIAITAVFERIAQKYTVTFEGNFEGSEYSESITETYGSKYIIPTEEPKRTGYTFLGWYTNSTGGTKITSDSVVDITSDISLYAQWKKNSSRGGGTSDSSSKPAFIGTWGNPVTGIWTRDTDGVWHFRTNAPFVSTWGYIVNPYAQAGQNQADWFWFDDNGRMLTGWQYINGHWYYLNPSKDGTLGSCLIGPGRTPDGYEIDASGAWIGR